MVYVLSKSGQPLMPTEDCRKVRLLLKKGFAVVARRTPFTIRLTTKSRTYTQPVILGIDAGSKTIGISASTEKKELFAAEAYPRNDVVKNLSDRRQFRRTRRNRKTRYRKPRFNNRIRSKHKGWLAPSVEVKIQEHITLIKRICKLLPISKIVVETAEFNLQLIKAVMEGEPVPQGEDYQKGEMYGFYNVKQYVLFRDSYKCQYCGLHGNGVRFHVHHKESRKTNGNAPDNLITLCEDCHKKLHSGIITDLKLKKRSRQSTRDAAFMGIMRKTLIERLRRDLSIPIAETKGYITKYVRENILLLPKSHTNDALAIAQGRYGFNLKNKLKFRQADRIYKIKAVRHHNRQLHKASILKGGIRKTTQAPIYVKGFRLFDKVLYQKQECFIWGRRSSGAFLLRLLDGSKIKDGVSYKKLRLLERSSQYLIA